MSGGKTLRGEVHISGAKNAAVAIIPAALLVQGECIIENIPDIKDVDVILNILNLLGAKIEYEKKGKLKIDCSGVNTHIATDDGVKQMRASYYLLGALLGRFAKVVTLHPGGCNFGCRPIDQHIKGFEALGATVIQKEDYISASAESGELTANTIYLDIVSVGATINIMLAAVKAKGLTVIENAAKEPHVVDVANFLNSMGAKIKGAGTDVIKITGVDVLKGGSYSIIPDQIEAGTFMIMAAAAGGEVLVKNVIPKHMESISAKLIEMNVEIEENDDSILVRRNGPLHRANVKTLPYPGFPTDMQPQIVALLSIAEGNSVVSEGVWDDRFQYLEELVKFGAKIELKGRNAYITGVEKLKGAKVRSTDLRAGAAVLICALVAEGETEISEIKHIDRGYEQIEFKLRSLGADIKRIISYD